jgi:hypothetical protein
MKWFIVMFLIYQGQPYHLVGKEPFASEAQCKRSLDDGPEMRAALKQFGYKNLVMGCKLIGEQ